MNRVERVKEICKERKIPISKVERDLGYANGYIGQLKKGVFPADRLLDIAEYLGSKEITLQTAYGFTYLKDFLGLGDVIVSPELEKGTVYGTAKENIAGAYIPTNNGDVADTFGLTSDTTGLVGMVHTSKTDNATIETLLMCGVKFFVEYVDGVFKGTITPGEAA